MVPVIENDDIRRAAEELVERHGDGAITVARERVETLTKSDDPGREEPMSAALAVTFV